MFRRLASTHAAIVEGNTPWRVCTPVFHLITVRVDAVGDLARCLGLGMPKQGGRVGARYAMQSGR